MVRPLAMDLRERAVARNAAGESVRKVARALSVAPSRLVKWMQRLRATGSVAPGKIGGHVPPKIAGAHRAWLVARTAAAAFPLRGRVAELAGRGLRVDYRPSGHLSAAKASASKKTVLASEQNRPDVARKRRRGRPARGALIRGGWSSSSSSMKPGQDKYGAVARRAHRPATWSRIGTLLDLVPTNAQIISSTQDTLPCKVIPL